MNVEFTVNKPYLWLQNLAKNLNVEIHDNTIYLPENIGEGFIKQFHFEKEFTLNYLHFRLNRHFSFVRKPGDEKDVSPIFFYVNNSIYEQQIEGNSVEVGMKTANGIFWPSNQIETKWTLPLNEWISNISVTIYHKWLIDCVDNEKDGYINQLINQKRPYYVFEEITAEMIPVIKAIEVAIQNKPGKGISNLYLKSKTIELLTLFFKKLIERPISKNLKEIHPDDIEKIFIVKNKLFENLSTDISIKQTAIDHGMSESKLQKLFKHVFGKSIYQYILNVRLEHSKHLLESGKYSVSEVGYKVGYTNLSHFSEMFYKHFGAKPKQFLSTQPKNINKY